MTDHSTLNYVRQADHDQLAEQVDAFLARGGQIQRLPTVFIVDDASKPRSQVPVVRQPVHVNHPNAATRATKPPREPRPPRSRAKPPELRKVGGVPPVKTEATLAAVRAGCHSAAAVAAHTGAAKACENFRLRLLSQRGLLVKRGGKFDTTWHIPTDHQSEANNGP